MKKGSAQIWWIIIAAVLAIVVLIVVLLIFTEGTTTSREGLFDCKNKGGSCDYTAQQCSEKGGSTLGLDCGDDDKACCFGAE